MNKQEVLKQIAEKRLELRALELQLHADTRQVFEAEIAEFFAEHPIVQSLTFEQYTPYFNDGDVCTFTTGDPELHDGVHDEWPYHLLFTDNPRYRPLTREPRYLSEPNPAYTDAHRAAEETIKGIWREYDADQFEGMYGDHVRVTFRPGTVAPTVEDHTDHD